MPEFQLYPALGPSFAEKLLMGGFFLDGHVLEQKI